MEINWIKASYFKRAKIMFTVRPIAFLIIFSLFFLTSCDNSKDSKIVFQCETSPNNYFIVDIYKHKGNWIVREVDAGEDKAYVEGENLFQFKINELNIVYSLVKDKGTIFQITETYILDRTSGRLEMLTIKGSSATKSTFFCEKQQRKI